MKFLNLLLLSLLAVACSKKNVEPMPEATPAPTPVEANGERTFFKDAEIVVLHDYYTGADHKGFIFMPTAPTVGPTKWVWYAPTLMANGGTPMELQHTFYVNELRAHGFAVVGCDVGESFGSPQGRTVWKAFYDTLIAKGFQTQGVFLLQSRGGLQGYSFIKDNPSVVKAVAGIYPMVTYDDYAGPSEFCKAWGFSLVNNVQCVSDFNAVKGQTDALANASSFSFPIYHVHGTDDVTVHYSNAVLFRNANNNVTLETVVGQEHEFYSVEFFKNDSLLNFIYTHGG